VGFSWQSLIDPISIEQFDRDYFSKRPLHLKARLAPETGLETIGGWREILRGQALRIEGHRAFVDIDPTADREQSLATELDVLLKQGGPVIVNKIDKIHPVALSIASTIATGLSGRTGANAYISPNRKDAQDLHADDHEVVVLQLHGTKRWTIGSSIARGMVASNLFNIDHKTLKRRALEHDQFRAIDLDPGDLLYLPRGMFHQATSVSAISIHMTFSALRPTGLDFAEVVLKELITDVKSRDYFPKFEPGDENTAIRAHMDRITERLEALSRDDSIRNAFIDLYREVSSGRRDKTGL